MAQTVQIDKIEKLKSLHKEVNLIEKSITQEEATEIIKQEIKGQKEVCPVELHLATRLPCDKISKALTKLGYKSDWYTNQES
ncbi:MAG: hypothetical protein ACE5FT_04445 [Candidatus Nanoarchaeia archaeon]